MMKSKANFLSNEMTLLGDYLKSHDFDQELKFMKLDEDSAADEKSPSKDDKIYYPMSHEGRSILIEELSIRVSSLL